MFHKQHLSIFSENLPVYFYILSNRIKNFKTKRHSTLPCRENVFSSDNNLLHCVCLENRSVFRFNDCSERRNITRALWWYVTVNKTLIMSYIHHPGGIFHAVDIYFLLKFCCRSMMLKPEVKLNTVSSLSTVNIYDVAYTLLSTRKKTCCVH